MATHGEPEPSVWSRLERHGSMAVAATSAITPSPAETGSTKSSQSRLPRLHWRFLDALGVFFWAYLFTKLFVADVDRALLAAVAPNLLPLVDFRVLA